MTLLYPQGKVLPAVVMLLMIINSAKAQSHDYAVVKSSASQVSVKSAHITVINILERSASQVALSWAPFPGAVSHYVLERSIDGKNFQEAGVFFTGEWLEEPVYRYTDRLRKRYTGPLFYRLRVVGMNGDEQYTWPTILKAQP